MPNKVVEYKGFRIEATAKDLGGFRATATIYDGKRKLAVVWGDGDSISDAIDAAKSWVRGHLKNQKKMIELTVPSRKRLKSLLKDRIKWKKKMDDAYNLVERAYGVTPPPSNSKIYRKYKTAFNNFHDTQHILKSEFEIFYPYPNPNDL